MADQMAAPFMAPWGGPAIAPAIDRLAAEGVVFESTYSNSPIGRMDPEEALTLIKFLNAQRAKAKQD